VRTLIFLVVIMLGFGLGFGVMGPLLCDRVIDPLTNWWNRK
jgi:hypothetical protein